MDLQEKALKYGIYLGRRYKDNEKELFINEIGSEFQKLGYDVQARYTKLKRFKGLNLYVGDLVNAKNIVVAHYDTPINSFDKNMVFYPFNIEGTERNQQEVSKRVVLYIALAAFVLMFLIFKFSGLEQMTLNILAIIITCLLSAVGFYILRGIGNPINSNLNTSGVLGALAIAEKHPKETAYVLTDRECIDNLGDVMLQESLPKSIHTKNIIHLRGIGSDVKSIVIGHTVSNKEFAEEISKGQKNVSLYELTDTDLKRHSLSYYDRAVSISAASNEDGFWEIKDVFNNKDLEINEAMFTQVVNMCLDYLK